PFDHASQVELFVDTSVPSPGKGRSADGETFEQAIAARVHDHVIATDGGAFVLFNSFALLNKTADALRPGLMAMGMDIFVHGKSGPRNEILEAFRNSARGVLFGAASFWQGVDVRGDALRNVIITRLPFDPPDRPIVEARGERIREQGGDPFRDDALPRAVIRFKQGFGRLIRSAGDRGRVVVLDPRVVTTGYGRSFMAAVPTGVPLRRLPEPEDPAEPGTNDIPF
ncbi:MAG: helicase C-terminal domain-containing protein, partial [Planctomycetota bacterium]